MAAYAFMLTQWYQVFFQPRENSQSLTRIIRIAYNLFIYSSVSCRLVNIASCKMMENLLSSSSSMIETSSVASQSERSFPVTDAGTYISIYLLVTVVFIIVWLYYFSLYVFSIHKCLFLIERRRLNISAWFEL